MADMLNIKVVTLKIPADLHRRAKLRLVEIGKSWLDYVTGLIEADLAKGPGPHVESPRTLPAPAPVPVEVPTMEAPVETTALVIADSIVEPTETEIVAAQADLNEILSQL